MLFFLLLNRCYCFWDLSDVINGVKNVIEFVCKLPDYTTEIKNKIQDLQDNIEDKIEDVRDRINDKVDEVKGKVTDTKDAVVDKVTEVKTYVVDLAPLIISSVLVIILIVVDVKVCLWRRDRVIDKEDEIVRELNHRLLTMAGKITHKSLLSLSADELLTVMEEVDYIRRMDGGGELQPIAGSAKVDGKKEYYMGDVL